MLKEGTYIVCKTDTYTITLRPKLANASSSSTLFIPSCNTLQKQKIQNFIHIYIKILFIRYKWVPSKVFLTPIPTMFYLLIRENISWKKDYNHISSPLPQQQILNGFIYSILYWLYLHIFFLIAVVDCSQTNCDQIG